MARRDRGKYIQKREFAQQSLQHESIEAQKELQRKQDEAAKYGGWLGGLASIISLIPAVGMPLWGAALLSGMATGVGTKYGADTVDDVAGDISSRRFFGMGAEADIQASSISEAESTIGDMYKIAAPVAALGTLVAGGVSEAFKATGAEKEIAEEASKNVAESITDAELSELIVGSAEDVMVEWGGETVNVSDMIRSGEFVPGTDTFTNEYKQLVVDSMVDPATQMINVGEGVTISEQSLSQINAFNESSALRLSYAKSPYFTRIGETLKKPTDFPSVWESFVGGGTASTLYKGLEAKKMASLLGGNQDA